MKNEVNRAFTAKKKQYIQPEVLVSQVDSITVVCASMPFGPGDPFDAI